MAQTALRRIFGVACSLVAACGATVAHADNPGRGPSDGSVAAMLDAMNAETLAQRELAESIYDGAGAAGVEALLDVLTRPDLTPEQRARTRHIARSMMLQLPAGGLGVRFQQRWAGGLPLDFDGQTVVISETVPGFPAAETLLPNDEVLAINGVRLRGTPHFQRLILGRLPGETLRLLVARSDNAGGPAPALPADEGLDQVINLVTVDVGLGRFTDLGNTPVPRVPHGDGVLIRIAESETPPPVSVGSGLTAEAWLEAEGVWVDGPITGLADPRADLIDALADEADDAEDADGAGRADSPFDETHAGVVLRLAGQPPSATPVIELFRSNDDTVQRFDAAVLETADSAASEIEYLTALYRERSRDLRRGRDVLSRLQAQRRGNNMRLMVGQGLQQQLQSAKDLADVRDMIVAMQNGQDAGPAGQP